MCCLSLVGSSFASLLNFRKTLRRLSTLLFSFRFYVSGELRNWIVSFLWFPFRFDICAQLQEYLHLDFESFVGLQLRGVSGSSVPMNAATQLRRWGSLLDFSWTVKLATKSALGECRSSCVLLGQCS